MLVKLFLAQILIDNFLVQLEVILTWFVNTLVNVFWLAEFFFLFSFFLVFVISKQFLYNSIFVPSYLKSHTTSRVEDVHIRSYRKWSLINTQSTYSISKLTPMAAIARLKRNK